MKKLTVVQRNLLDAGKGSGIVIGMLAIGIGIGVGARKILEKIRGTSALMTGDPILDAARKL